MNVIDGYLTELGRTLSGPASAKTDLLAEARDGLRDAADAYREGGWSRADAERRAIEEFGSIGEVAADYQAELAMHDGVRTLWKLIVGVPMMQLAWDFARIVSFGDWTRLTTPSPGWYTLIARATHGVVFLIPVFGLLALLATRWLSRRLDGRRLARISAVSIAVAVGLNLASLGLIIAANGIVDASRLFLTIPCGLLLIAWIGVSARLAVLARRTWDHSTAALA